MTARHFRNVDVAPDAPVASWPLEAIRSVLERGDIRDYGELVGEVRRAPWGGACWRIEAVLEFTQPYGSAVIMRRAIDHSRAVAKQREREWVAHQLGEALERSGLSRAEFARELGTSQSRLSTYLNGSVSPAATLLARARSVADRA